jgi:uncharacterized alpha/beta hydrolase family protein
MKHKFHILILIALAAIVGSALAQVSSQKQETTAQQVREGRTDAEPLISTLARGLVDRTDSMILSAPTRRERRSRTPPKTTPSRFPMLAAR